MITDPENFDHIVIENISPIVDCGTFPAKSITGEPLRIEADILMEGHDLLAGIVSWRKAGTKTWQEMPLDPLGNDRYAASITPQDAGYIEFRIGAWNDFFGTWRRDIRKKLDAGADVALDIEEGRELLRRLLPKRTQKIRLAALLQDASSSSLPGILSQLDTPGFQDDLGQLQRENMVFSQTYSVWIDRPLAAFSAWYEIFPRSQSTERGRHGTFRDCEARLPAIRAMGFDILYLTPIHPISRHFRKGRNNDLNAGPDDPGSPYAIGSEDGGHKDIHPELGTLQDFRRLVESARGLGMEVALDLAVQCSPDHPYVTEHPGWFHHRTDGSIAYAENPPKKYQDIVNPDFACGDSKALWEELRSIVLFWIKQGVTIFRVDNPHTKPFAFWQWLIETVHEKNPEIIFLAEAFTRPKVMYRLAKIGFSQSYTYFTWRSSKEELTEYLTELTRTPIKNFFRPNFFPTTPDIFPYHLRGAGRPGFMLRVALAAMLSGNYGIYGGYELCEGEPLGEAEEYRDSEKYEIKTRNWDAPGHIKDFIAALNRIRNEHPVMRDFSALRFYPSTSDHVLFFGYVARDNSCALFTAVNLDPHHAQETHIELPLQQLGLPHDAPYRLDDLLLGHSWQWSGTRQHLRLEPEKNPVAVFRWKK